MRTLSEWSIPAVVGMTAVATVCVSPASLQTTTSAPERGMSVVRRLHSVMPSAAGSPEATPSRKEPGPTWALRSTRRPQAFGTNAAAAAAVPPATRSSRRLKCEGGDMVLG